MLYLFVPSLVPAVIAGIITFSDRVMYATYGAAPRITSLSPVADQQIAGLIMKVVGTAVLWLLATIIWFIWANREEREPGGGDQPVARPRPAERS